MKSPCLFPMALLIAVSAVPVDAQRAAIGRAAIFGAPAPGWQAAIGNSLAQRPIPGLWALRQEYLVNPVKATAALSPVASVLEQNGISLERFESLPSRARDSELVRAFIIASGDVEQEAVAAIAEAKRAQGPDLRDPGLRLGILERRLSVYLEGKTLVTVKGSFSAALKRMGAEDRARLTAKISNETGSWSRKIGGNDAGVVAGPSRAAQMAHLAPSPMMHEMSHGYEGLHRKINGTASEPPSGINGNERWIRAVGAASSRIDLIVPEKQLTSELISALVGAKVRGVSKVRVLIGVSAVADRSKIGERLRGKGIEVGIVVDKNGEITGVYDKQLVVTAPRISGRGSRSAIVHEDIASVVRYQRRLQEIWDREARVLPVVPRGWMKENSLGFIAAKIVALATGMTAGMASAGESWTRSSFFLNLLVASMVVLAFAVFAAIVGRRRR